MLGCKLETIYPLVDISVERVGVAKFVIFYEFNETEVVGAVIVFNVLLIARYLESAV